jgi:hypothetical protein
MIGGCTIQLGLGESLFFSRAIPDTSSFRGLRTGFEPRQQLLCASYLPSPHVNATMVVYSFYIFDRHSKYAILYRTMHSSSIVSLLTPTSGMHILPALGPLRPPSLFELPLSKPPYLRNQRNIQHQRRT